MKTRVSLRYFLSSCPWKTFFDSDSPQTTSSLISLTFLVTLTPLNPLEIKIVNPNLKAEQLPDKKLYNFLYLVTAFQIFPLRFEFGIKRISSLF